MICDFLLTISAKDRIVILFLFCPVSPVSDSRHLKYVVSIHVTILSYSKQFL